MLLIILVVTFGDRDLCRIWVILRSRGLVGKLGSGVALNLGSRSSRRGKQPAQRYLYRYSISNLVLSFLLFHRPVFSPKFTALDSDTTFHSVGSGTRPPPGESSPRSAALIRIPREERGRAFNRGREGRGGEGREGGSGIRARVRYHGKSMQKKFPRCKISHLRDFIMKAH